MSGPPRRRSSDTRTTPERPEAEDEPAPTPPRTSVDAVRAVRRCLALLSPAERWRWGALLPLNLVAAGLEALGALLVLGLIRGITDPGGLEDSRWVGWVRRGLGAGEDTPTLVWLAFAVPAFFVVKNALLLFTTHYAGRQAAASVDRLSVRLLAGYLSAPWLDHTRRPSSELVRNVGGSVVGAYRMLLNTLVEVAKEIFLLVGLLVVLLVEAPGVTLGAAVGLGLILYAFMVASQRWIGVWSHRAHRLESELFGHLQRSLEGIKELQLNGTEGWFVNRFADTRARLSQLEYWQGTLHAAPRLAMESLFVVAVGAVLLWFHRQDRVEAALPTLGLFAYAGFRMLPTLHRITGGFNVMRYGSVAIDEIWDDLSRYSTPIALRPGPPPEPLARFRELRLDGVRFTYPEAARPALDGVDLVVPRGGSIGIVGATGAGKSTLLDMLLGFLDPDEGEIRIDGIRLGEVRDRWRRGLGYVSQTPYLLDDTLLRNVTFGGEDAGVDRKRVQDALEQAQLTALIDRLPEGLETHVGERGVRLSGGERQRVAIARALYRAPAVLVLDEATSNVDNQTERAIARALHRLRGELTLIVVAHRMETVRALDRIHVMDGGRVVAAGAYDALLEKSERFRALALAEVIG